jgi:hypothetical protein
MNPGAIEEAGKAASTIIESMKNQPTLLAVLVLNFVFLGFMYISLNKTYDRTTKQLERGDELLAQALARCK